VSDQTPPQNPPPEGDNETITPVPVITETTTQPPVQEQVPAQVQVRLPTRPPKVTYTIMAVTVLVFILQRAIESLYGYDWVAFWGLKHNELILYGEVWRLFTPMLVHSGILHIAFNMYALYAFGPTLERFYGHGRFLLLYIVSGFGGVAASFALTAAPSLGSSTAIFGLLGAQGVFAYQNQRVFGERARKALGSIINIAIINLILGFTPGIDNWGHMGGLASGLMVSWFGGPVYRLAGTATDLYLENQRNGREFNLAVLGTVLVIGMVVVGVFVL
jgi:rhomboid protease GluP